MSALAWWVLSVAAAGGLGFAVGMARGRALERREVLRRLRWVQQRAAISFGTPPNTGAWR